ncbi:MAG: hypothetical protein CHACPFDD_03531 [Phycisphaerae bacterium]|nr:hypothetical protein [Phycisphaerae bacterium]
MLSRHDLLNWTTGFLVCALDTVGLASADGPYIRFFFDTAGSGEQEDRGAGDLALTNPTVFDEGRLYLYAQYLVPQETWFIVSLDFEVTGGAVITGWNVFNHYLDPVDRWTDVGNKAGAGMTTKIDDVYMATVGVEPGLFVPPNDFGIDDPKHFRDHQEDHINAFGNTLVGYIDVSANGSAYSELRFGVGAFGIDSREGAFAKPITFGFGDENAGLFGNSYGMQSPIADATIVPEPATLGLMLVAASRVRRRSGSGARAVGWRAPLQRRATLTDCTTA